MDAINIQGVWLNFPGGARLTGGERAVFRISTALGILSAAARSATFRRQLLEASARIRILAAEVLPQSEMAGDFRTSAPKAEISASTRASDVRVSLRQAGVFAPKMTAIVSAPRKTAGIQSSTLKADVRSRKRD